MKSQTFLCRGTDAETLINFNGSRLTDKQTIRLFLDVIKENVFLQTVKNNIVNL
jgi:hypothetical protein